MTHTYTETHEERVLRLIGIALDAAQGVKEDAPSRENSLAVTHLEDAQMRAQRDIDEKGK